VKLSKFKKLQMSLERKGYSKDAAGAIAYKVGVAKYGKKGMAKKAALGRKRAEEHKA
jgi:hypothetical protein